MAIVFDTRPLSVQAAGWITPINLDMPRLPSRSDAVRYYDRQIDILGEALSGAGTASLGGTTRMAMAKVAASASFSAMPVASLAGPVAGPLVAFGSAVGS